MDPVNVKSHFSLETKTLCSATQNHPAGVTHCLSRSKGRVRPEENSNPPKNVTGLFCVKEEQTNVKFSNSGIQSVHPNQFLFIADLPARATGLLSASISKQLKEGVQVSSVLNSWSGIHTLVCQS